MGSENRSRFSSRLQERLVGFEAGVYVGANALEVPETGTTVRLKEGKRRVQDGPLLPTPAGFIILRPLRDTLRPQIFYTERR